MLKMIAAADPDNKRHCIRLINSFMHRNHLCLVLEPMQYVVPVLFSLTETNVLVYIVWICGR